MYDIIEFIHVLESLSTHWTPLHQHSPVIMHKGEIRLKSSTQNIVWGLSVRTADDRRIKRNEPVSIHCYELSQLIGTHSAVLIFIRIAVYLFQLPNFQCPKTVSFHTRPVAETEAAKGVTDVSTETDSHTVYSWGKTYSCLPNTL